MKNKADIIENKTFSQLTDEEILMLKDYSALKEIFWLEPSGRCWEPSTDHMAIFMLTITFKNGQIWDTNWRGGRTYFTSETYINSSEDYTKDRERLISFLKNQNESSPTTN